MITVHTVENLRKQINYNSSVGFVPTMGNLHAGHLDLLAKAKEACDFVVASIFVNRLQFGPNEDFDSYPRTLDEDCEKLRAAGCDLVFAPSERDLYPTQQTVKVHANPVLGDILEGEFRPGFFTGVSTVVLKLLNCVQPHKAFFGKKDFQQVLVVKDMVSQLALPVEIVEIATKRESDGLAMSSRNGYLTPSERAEAVHLQRALCQLRDSFKSGVPKSVAEKAAVEYLSTRGWRPDYVCIRSTHQFTESAPEHYSADTHFVALGAARIGTTRLIDNIEF
jgi:pantoate--beta-alanine ligase